jgi:hypothetical protein
MRRISGYFGRGRGRFVPLGGLIAGHKHQGGRGRDENVLHKCPSGAR